MKGWTHVKTAGMGLLLTSLVAACSAPAAPQGGAGGTNQNKDGKTVITWLQWWKSDVGEGPLNELKQAFEAKNPDIVVDIQDMPFAQVHDKLVTLNASGNVPDVLTISSPWVAEFAIAGISEPLDEYFKAMPEEFQKNAQGPLWTPWQGKRYSIGFFTGNVALFYNKKKLEEAGVKPPTTWDEFLKASVALSDPGKNKYAITGNIGAEPPSTVTYEVWPLILQAGGKLIENNRAAFNSDAGVKALEYYKSLIKTRKVATPGELSAGEKEKRANFSSENTAFMLEGPWGISIQKKANPNLEFGIVPLPVDVAAGTIAGGTSVGIAAKSKNKEAAWKFVSFLAGPEAQVMWAKSTNNFPHNKKALQDAFIQGDPMLKVFADQFAINPINPDLQMPQSNEMRKMFINEVQNFLTDKKTARQALDDAAKAWNDIFSRYN